MASKSLNWPGKSRLLMTLYQGIILWGKRSHLFIAENQKDKGKFLKNHFKEHKPIIQTFIKPFNFSAVFTSQIETKHNWKVTSKWKVTAQRPMNWFNSKVPSCEQSGRVFTES